MGWSKEETWGTREGYKAFGSTRMFFQYAKISVYSRCSEVQQVSTMGACRCTQEQLDGTGNTTPSKKHIARGGPCGEGETDHAVKCQPRANKQTQKQRGQAQQKGGPTQSDGRDAPDDDTSTRNRDIPARRWLYNRHPWRPNRRRGQTPSRYVPRA